MFPLLVILGIVFAFVVFAWFHPADYKLHQKRMSVFTSKRPLKWLPMSSFKSKDEYGVILVKDSRFGPGSRYKVLFYSNGCWFEFNRNVKYDTATMKTNNAQWRRLE